MNTIAAVSTTSDVTSASTPAEAMVPPAVVIAPACPRADTEEDAIIEIARPIKTTGSAAVWCIIVVAVGTNRRIYAYGNLCVQSWHEGRGCEQGRRTDQKHSARCEFVNHTLDLPHYVYPLGNSHFRIESYAVFSI